MPSNFWKVVNKTAESVEIDVYGDIGEDIWGDGTSVSAREFLDEVRDAKGKAIDLHVNSGGGSVFDAFAMMTALAAHDGKVTAYVDGIAASAASFLLAGADEVRMSSVAYIMIHNASTVAFGNSEAIRETAEWLDNIDRQLAGIYAKRSGRDADDFLALMGETTWFTADEAVEAGLVDHIDEAVAVAACVTLDRASLDTAPEGAHVFDARDNVVTITEPAPEADEPLASTVTDGTATGQEPVEPAQERHVVIDGCVYTFHDLTD